MPTLEYHVFGRREGNFAPPKEMSKRSAFIHLIEEVEHKHIPMHVQEIVAPRVGFTTRVAEPTEKLDMWSERFLRTEEPADGALVRGTSTAVAIFNGDCPLVCLHQDDQLAVLHGGYRCLIRADPNEEGIIEVAMKHFDPAKTEALIFGGIGPCCWLPEYDDKPEILDPAKSRYPELLAKCLSVTGEKSPAGSGHVSVDLHTLVCGLLAGFHLRDITCVKSCTCCALGQDQPLYWSHTRYKAGKQEGVDGRNFSVAWLRP